MSTGCKGKEDRDGTLSLWWSVFYLGCALLVSLLYYRNPALWQWLEQGLR